MKRTKNLGLNLPEMGDVINIDDINENTEKMDTMSHPNLLLNPWFTVNQLWKTDYFGQGYFVDGWSTFRDNVAVKVTPDGILLSDNTDFNGIGQLIDNPQKYNGLKMTASCIVENTGKASWYLCVWTYQDYSDDGTRYILGQTEIPVGFSGIASFSFDANIPSDRKMNVLFTQNTTKNDGLLIKAVKLELGSVSTLANDIAPDYGTELARCQRHQLVMDIPYFQFGARITSPNTAIFFIPTPVTMRATPRLTGSKTGYIFDSAGPHVASNLRVGNYTSNGVLCYIDTLDALAVNTTATVEVTDGITFDANL